MNAVGQFDLLDEFRKIYGSDIRDTIRHAWYQQDQAHCILHIQLQSGSDEVIILNSTNSGKAQPASGCPITLNTADDIVDNAQILIHTDVYWLCYLSDLLFTDEFKRIIIAWHHHHE
jgi:hypothetical protein